MSKTVFGMATEIVNGVWKMSGEVVNAVSDEYDSFVKEETNRRVLERTTKGNPDALPVTYMEVEKEVRKEIKSFAIRGGLLAFGLGALF